MIIKLTKLFDGTLGFYPHRKVHKELLADEITKHARPYSVTHVQLKVLRKELLRLCKLNVLEPIEESKWAHPSFNTSKKDGTVCWISNLQELNKVIKWKVYPLPIITDILCRLTGYKFFTKLDISMQYYAFELDEESKELCIIITKFGKYKYKRLQMGLKCAPDFAHQAMEKVSQRINDTEVYIYDIGCLSNDWEHHLKLLDQVMTALKTNGFQLTQKNANGRFKKMPVLATGLPPMV